MPASFLTGALAGAAVAIPVGAVAILIVELALRCGFRTAAAAGLGAATADGFYAGLAALGGSAASELLAPFAAWLRVVAVVALLAVALRGILRALRAQRNEPAAAVPPTPQVATYLRFVALTLLNPQTIVYFSALILGLPDVGRGPTERFAFVAGAFLASAGWQLLLAGLAAIGHRRLPGRFQLALSVAGNLVIVGFALGIALDLVA
jgi:threonine/homoserine/homoserine lactone efflux protein